MFIFTFLFLSKINLNRYAREVPLLAHLVLKIAAIRLLDILRQIHKEGKLRRWGGELCSILDADILALG